MKHLREVTIALSIAIPMAVSAVVWAYATFATIDVEDRIVRMETKIDEIHWFLIGRNK